MRIFPLLIGIIGLCKIALSQPPSFHLEQISAEQGLESSTVFGIYEDKQGLIWMASYDGLYKYDGYRARKINIRLCETCPPLNQAVKSILQISNTEQWILSTYGVGKLNPITGLLRIVVPNKNAESYDAIEPLDDSIIQISGPNKYPVLLNRFSEKFTLLSNEEPVYPPGKEIGSILLNKPESQSGLYRLNSLNKVYKKLSGSLQFKLVQTSIPMAGESQLPAIIIKEFKKGAFSVFKQENGPSWICSTRGLFFLGEKDSVMYDMGDVFPILKDKATTYLKVGSNGVLWVSVRGIGVVKLVEANLMFNHINIQGPPQHALQRDFVLGLYPANNGQLFVRHDFDYLVSPTLLDVKTLKTSAATSTLIKELETYYYNGQPMLLNEGFYKGIDSLKAHFQLKETPLDVTNIFSNKLSNHYYTLFTLNGLKRMPENKTLLQHIVTIHTKFQGDTLWIGTESIGLVALHLPSGAIKQYGTQANTNNGPAHNRIHGFCFDRAGNLWIGTSNGLSYFNKSNRQFAHYGTAQGLCHPVIYNITFDHRGHLWLGTGNGLSRFDTAQKTFTNYFTSDGLINTEYNRNSAYTSPDGMVFMGGTKGVDYFDPNNIIQQSNSIKPVIVEIDLPDRSLNPAMHHVFKPNENNIHFSFTASPVSEAKNCTYQYRLQNGQSGDWQNLSTGHQLQFANLAAGSYTLHLRVVNQYGEKSNTETSFSFDILSPWYESGWLKLVIAILAVAFLWILISRRQREALRKLQHENQLIKLKAEQAIMLANERERITADLHDDVGATLSSLNIYGDLAQNIWDTQPEKSKDMLQKVSSQAKELMGRMNDIVWSLKTTESHHSKITDRIKNYGQEFLGNRDILVEYDMDENLAAEIVNPMVRKNLMLIAKEAMNNIAKYSRASGVQIILKKEEQNLNLIITDNGQGFDANGQHEGNGLSNMSKRVNQMGGSFNMETLPGKGVTISIFIPLAIISYTT